MHVLVSSLHTALDIKYSSVSFSLKIGLEPRINTQLTGKISLELDSILSLLLEYGRKSCSLFALCRYYKTMLGRLNLHNG